MAYSDFLEGLLREEVCGRKVRKQSMMTRLAGFSSIKTLDDFNYDFAKGVKKGQIEELAGLGFVERFENVVLVGPSGVGKTHPAITLGSGHASRLHDVLHDGGGFDVDDGALAEQPEDDHARAIKAYRLLIIDEIGYLPMTREQANLFFQVIAAPHEKGNLIVTSNLPFHQSAKNASILNRC